MNKTSNSNFFVSLSKTEWRRHSSPHILDPADPTETIGHPTMPTGTERKWSPHMPAKILHKIQHANGTRPKKDNVKDNVKAMSMPHGTVADENERWNADKHLFPSRVDWTVQASNGAHIWLDSDSSCMLQECKKTGPRKRCAACKLVAHSKCIEMQDRAIFPKCRSTFRDGADEPLKHHTVRRRKQEGRCDACGKNFQSMLSYKTTKEFIAQNCSWCKRSFHLKPECLKTSFLTACDLGVHKNTILPPSWVAKLPPRKYSQMNKQMKGNKVSTRRPSSKERRAFVIKPAPSEKKCPLVVFVNPKSGGNQGTKILEKCQYILNPRQVFDLSQGGPRFGLELFRKVPNMRILVCGGDGTVGWILSEIDKLRIEPYPPVSVLPLGTGNDLSRFLGWGAGYTDEPLDKILTHVEEGEVQKLDRWNIDVRVNQEAIDSSQEVEGAEDNVVNKLPLSVMNNYYSLGADADVCLEFHESREANPAKFKSRLKNLYFYGKKGSEKIIKRKSKDLYKCVNSIICDDMNLTEMIKELKPLCLIFLNISSYSAGTSPWGNPSNEEFLPQNCDDGYLEIIALTSTSMVSTQVGGHGIRICQCQSAVIHTSNKISMQVDGEPCRLNPAKIHIKHRNQASMICKKKPHYSNYFLHNSPCPEKPRPLLSTKLYYLTFAQYVKLVHYDIEEINAVVEELCSLDVSLDWQLDDLRKRLDAMHKTEQVFEGKLTDEWCFLDASWTARIYRIDEAQESLLHAGDVLENGIYVLDLGKSLTPPSVTISSNASESGTTSPSATRKRPQSLLEGQLLHDCEDRMSLHSPSESTLVTSEEESDLTDYSEEDELNEDTNSGDNTTSPSEEASSTENEPDNLQIPDDDEQCRKEFFEAAQAGHLKKFRMILEMRRVKLIDTTATSGRNALHLAAMWGRKGVVDYILEQGMAAAGVDLVDKENHTALHLAAMNKKRTICRKLLKAGASVTRQDTEGNTPQLLAAKAEDRDLAKFLEKEERLQLIAADDHETAV